MRLFLAATLIASSQAANDGVAVTPPMGCECPSNHSFHRSRITRLTVQLRPCSHRLPRRHVTRAPTGRDWNLFQCKINQQIMMATMDAVADASRGVSLAGLGYTDVGLGA